MLMLIRKCFVTVAIFSVLMSCNSSDDSNDPGETEEPSDDEGNESNEGDKNDEKAGESAGLPTVSVLPADGTALGTSSDLVFTFSAAMDKTTLALTGNVETFGNGGVWSKVNVDDDTLTLSPTATWNAAEPLKVTINAKDAEGNELKEVTLEFPVVLELSNFQAASHVIGQSDFTSNDDNQGGSAAANTLNGPWNISASAGVLYITDYSNNRVLGYNSVPTASGASADFAIGQPDLTSSTGDTTAAVIEGPEVGMAYDSKFFLGSYDNNRILIYNSIPTSSGATADVVLGQADFTSNSSGCTAQNFDEFYSLYVAGGKLVAADAANSRILIWNSIPTVSQTEPDIVLGQSTFTNCSANDDNQDGSEDAAPSQRTLSYPTGVWTDGKKLAVIDQANNRVLIWNTFPTSSFAPADLVLGQSDFTKSTKNDDNQDGTPDSTPSARTFDLDSYPVGVFSNGTQLFLTDTYNNRVLVWDEFPTANFENADKVLGQSGFDKDTPNDDDQNNTSDGTPSARTFDEPAGISVYGNKVFVAGYENHRVMVFEGQ